MECGYINRYNFGFIHIPKNAGSSIKASHIVNDFGIKIKLDNIIDKELCNLTLGKFGFQYDSNHCRYKDITDKERELKIFSIVRNPWEREVSKYFYLKRFEDLSPEDYKGPRKRLVKKYSKKGEGFSFNSYLRMYDEFKNIPFMWLHASESFYNQLEYVTDDAGAIRCDILRHESVDSELELYFNGKAEIEKINSSDKHDYKGYYNNKLMHKVYDMYRDDIETFGFDFDTSATKNIWINR